MKVLITAGATEVPIDDVRAITNIFKGRTGTEIAVACALDGWSGPGRHRDHSPADVTLVTSNEPLARELFASKDPTYPEDGCCWPRCSPARHPKFRVLTYRTFDELATLMALEIAAGGGRLQPYDVVIHSAAVSDYRVSGIETQRPDGKWTSIEAIGKLSSAAPGMRLTLTPTPKLLNQIRHPWGFRGKLVQFKLEVGITDEELIARARTALARSHGDLVVANCLEWSRYAALLIDRDGTVERVVRSELPAALLRRLT